jgi:hypothetical protein
MTESEATETEHWRALSREVQGLSTDRQVRAQGVVDVAESVRRIADLRGTDPLDDLLELHARVESTGAKQMVADCLYYLRVEPLLAVRTS